jgi:transcriptional regulator with XRE-family HTH domain
MRLEEIVVDELTGVRPPSGSGPASPSADGIVTAVTLGAWLRSERLARGWTFAELGRRLYQAGVARGDGAVAGALSLSSYVPRWESDKCAPSRRYRMHYCAVFGIDPRQFGPAGVSLAGEGDSTARELPYPYVDEAGGLVVKIPHGCREIVIHVYPLFAAAGRDDTRVGIR